MTQCKFQIIDWYSENCFTDDNNYNDSDDTSDSDSDDSNPTNNLKYTIIIFGKDLEENTYSLQINNFTPYYYLKVPDDFCKSSIDIFTKWLKGKLPKQFKNDLVKITLHNKFKFRGFNDNKKFKWRYK